MMNWTDIASIVFVSVTVNHLGLIGKLEEMLGKLPILDCPKCLTFWSVIVYELWCVGFSDIPTMLAISFLASYAAIWLELFEGYIDTLYLRLYDKIYDTKDNTLTAADFDGDTTGTMP